MEGSCSIKATRNYKRAQLFIYNFTLYSLTSLVTCFFFFYQISSVFPSLINLAFPLPIPNAISLDFFSLDGKCSFIAVNIIIVLIAIQEYSTVDKSPSIYDEYVARSRSRVCSKVKYYSPDCVAGKEEGKSDENVTKSVSPGFVVGKEEGKSDEDVIKSVSCDEKRKKETRPVQKKSEFIPKEELNKRVEAFIAKVNNQRLIEAKLVDHNS